MIYSVTEPAYLNKNYLSFDGENLGGDINNDSLPFCVYLIVYSGNKLPPFYIGSTNKNKLRNGYLGSVRSKKYKNILDEEKTLDITQFKSFLISEHTTREEAFISEQLWQVHFDVLKDDRFYNQAIANTKLFSSTNAKPVCIDGIEYVSATAASIKLNLNCWTVLIRLRSPNFQNYEFIGKKKAPPIHHRLRQIVIDDVEYPSIAQAVRVLNITEPQIHRRVRSAFWLNYYYVGKQKKFKAKSPPKGGEKAVLINNIKYPSVRDAAYKLIINKETIRCRIKSPNFPGYQYYNDYSFIKAMNIDVTSNSKPVNINGTVYPSVAEASRKIDVHINTIYRRLALPEYLDYNYIGTPPKIKSLDRKNYKYKIANILYETINEAAKDLKINRKTICRYLNQNREGYVRL